MLAAELRARCAGMVAPVSTGVHSGRVMRGLRLPSPLSPQTDSTSCPSTSSPWPSFQTQNTSHRIISQPANREDFIPHGSQDPSKAGKGLRFSFMYLLCERETGSVSLSRNTPLGREVLEGPGQGSGILVKKQTGSSKVISKPVLISEERPRLSQPGTW